jgi:hypothetical protein
LIGEYFYVIFEKCYSRFQIKNSFLIDQFD